MSKGPPEGFATIFVLPFLVVYVVYYLSLYPSVAGGDSGELMAEACLGGVPHPPGYPLYTILSQVAAAMQVPRLHLDEGLRLILDTAPTMAWRVNHMCCVFGALAAANISASIDEILCGTRAYCSAAAWAGAFMFALSPLVWEYSIGGEVFALNNAVCSTIIYLGIKLTAIAVRPGAIKGQTPYRLWLMLGALCSGLALANQHSSLLLLIFVIPILWYRYRTDITLPFLSQLVCCGLVGLVPYIYIFVAAITPKEGSWGSTSTLAGLMRHILRAEYGTFQLGIIQGTEGSLERVFLYLKHLSAESYHIAVPLVAYGIYSALRARGKQPAAVGKSRPKKNWNGNTINILPGSGARIDHCSAASVLEGDMMGNTVLRSCVEFLLICWIGYTLVWHTVFSNLPLNAPMPFAVHSRSMLL